MLASKLHVKRSLFTNLLENIKYIVLFVTETLIYVWPRNLNLEYTTHKMYMGTMYREYDLLLFFWSKCTQDLSLYLFGCWWVVYRERQWRETEKKKDAKFGHMYELDFPLLFSSSSWLCRFPFLWNSSYFVDPFHLFLSLDIYIHRCIYIYIYGKSALLISTVFFWTL